MASLFKNWRNTYERIEKFISDTYFTDVNINKIINLETIELIQIEHLLKSTNPLLSTKDSLHLHDELALSFNDVVSQTEDQWELINPKTFNFGLTWSIHWFRVMFYVPTNWLEKQDCRIELMWDSGCEILVYSSSGRPIQGLNSTHSRRSIDISDIGPISKETVDGQYIVYLQASCSDLFGAGDKSMIGPPDMNKSFKIGTAQLRLVLRPAVTLRWDLNLLLQIAEALKDCDRGYEALFVANQVINTVIDLRGDDLSDKLSRARVLLDKFFQTGTSESITLHAIGHCHIDTAWLWRFGETRRKIARSWSTSLGLLEKHRHMKFACSQAQQFDWLKRDHPDLFARLQAAVRENRFVPVGGTWVEMDANLPGCESLCRQFLYGQRFFKAEFGRYCSEFWLPDTFGYAPQLPQLIRESRMTRFVTQKLSWSLVNKFPHHTFFWRGLDGSRVLTHFPPGDSYAMTGRVSEVLHSVRNFSDKGRSRSLLYLYGHGDGGQGPTEEMLHVLDRLGDCHGLPKVRHSSPEELFSRIETEDLPNLCTWTGELFLELHNGTYTTQRQLKLGNVHCEQMLRVVELLVSICVSNSIDPGLEEGSKGIRDQLETQWKSLLLNQFHDVLPGSSIEHVCDDAYWSHQSILSWTRSAIHRLATSLLGTVTSPILVNPTSWVLTVPLSSRHSPASCLGLCRIPPHSLSRVGALVAPPGTVQYSFNTELQLHQLSNQFIALSIDEQCRIHSMQLKAHPELGNLIPDGSLANQLMLYDDVPLYWDAWDVMDYHLETGANIDSLPSFCLVERSMPIIDSNSVTIGVKFCLKATGTIIEQSISVHGHLEYVQMTTKVWEWRETHRMVKVKIPTVAKAIDAQYRTQAGFHSRPTHRNTSWDAAKFEVCGHEWVHVGDANWGVGVFKEAIFGSSVVEGTVFLSLLRSPSSPDATADKKYLPHVFNYAICPLGPAETVSKFATLTRLATQFTWLCAWQAFCSTASHPSAPAEDMPHLIKSFPISLQSPINGEVAIDWIKPSCDYSNKVVIRLHEQIGGKFLVKLSSFLPIKEAQVTNLIEDLESMSETKLLHTADSIDVLLCPFKIVSIIVEFIQ